MRAAGLGMALAATALGACTVHELSDAGGPPGMDASRPDFPEPSAGSIFPSDASTGPVYSTACWADLLPQEPQPILPTSTVMDACAAGAAASSSDWSYPPNPKGTNGDDLGYIVGRWQVCNQSIFGLSSHAGIEFGANGRWRMLATDATTGDLVPMPRSQTTSGYYYMLGSGQLNLAPELPAGTHTYPVTFTAGMDAINFDNPAGVAEVYARTTPSPLNGADNPPPTEAGPCSMVGDWILPSTVPNGLSSVYSFDAAGNFVVVGSNVNICDTGEGYGTYALSTGMFQLTSTLGLGGCAWWYTAGLQAAFDATCNELWLNPDYDNCTGGRAYLNQPTRLTRRAASCCDGGTD